MPVVKVRDGVNINYELGGDEHAKNKVIFIMGVNANHRHWEFQFEYFSKLPDYQVLVFDNRGCGFSDVPEPPYTMTQMMNDVIDLANIVNWERFHLVGASMGGMIAQHVALNNLDRILSLTLICTRVEGGIMNSLPTFSATVKFIKMAKTTDPEALMKMGAELQFTPECLDSKTPEGITFREYFYNLIKKRMTDIPMTPPKGREGHIAVVRSHGLSRDQIATLKNAKFPILAIAGDEDILIKSSHGYNMPSLIGAKLLMLKGNGHGLLNQSPDIINEHIKNIIDESAERKDGAGSDNIVVQK